MAFLSFWDKHPNDFESVSSDTQTIPDQSLSVREILMRFTRGQMEMPPIDEGEDDTFDTPLVSDFDDLVDAHDSVVAGYEFASTISNVTDSNDSVTKSNESSTDSNE